MEQYFQKIYNGTKDNFNNLVKENLIKESKMFIVTANPETLMFAEKNADLKMALLDDKTTIIADGIGIIKGAKILKYNIKETIPGVELCTELFKYCDKYKKSIFLLGAKEEVVSKLVKVINKDYPNAVICGYENGYVKDKQKAFDKIVSLKPDVVLVALGIPQQEILIYNNLDKFNKGIFIGVGGSFDVLSGTKKRAPKLFRKLHLEWLYRILKEPKRLKRFFSSNVKYLLQLTNINLLDFSFIFIISIILISGFIKTIFLPKDINYYENRPAYKVADSSILKFSTEEFQDNLELALSDQIPFAQTMKKLYNFSNNFIIKSLLDIIPSNNYNDYLALGNGIFKVGDENNLVYSRRYLDLEKDNIDIKIANINNIVKNYPDTDFYVYYIEKDTDINFFTHVKSQIREYIFDNLNLPKTNYDVFEINSFDEYKNYFYKTDHHWNYKGSYTAYCKVLKMLKPDETPIPTLDTVCLSNNFSGSKSSSAGFRNLYKEPFYVYKLNLKSHETFINGKPSRYSYINDIYDIDPNGISYGSFYGGDFGEVIFDYNNPDSENILIFGESYDNAIVELLASHFNKTYSVDLRAYEMDMGNKFNLKEYLNKNNISKVLFIGNVDFYIMEEFLLEV